MYYPSRLIKLFKYSLNLKLLQSFRKKLLELTLNFLVYSLTFSY